MSLNEFSLCEDRLVFFWSFGDFLWLISLFFGWGGVNFGDCLWFNSVWFCCLDDSVIVISSSTIERFFWESFGIYLAFWKENPSLGFWGGGVLYC